MQKESSLSPRLSLVRDLFFSPISAFEAYYQKTNLGGKDLWFAHIQLFLLAPITKFLGNSIQILIFKVTTVDEETRLTFTQGCASVFIFYFIMYFIFRLVDSFRMYHQMRDRSTDWEGPEPHVFTLSFLPFSSTAIFWFLPNPIPLFLLMVGFFYSLHLSYFYLSQRRNWTAYDFFFFILKVVLFFLVLASVPLFFYNIIRTVLF
ncbi:hypothetical protein P3G55_06310 [Leptospira sp. 96542]|nr:hypothetical protein [Leptospira sp. 96542]